MPFQGFKCAMCAHLDFQECRQILGVAPRIRMCRWRCLTMKLWTRPSQAYRWMPVTRSNFNKIEVLQMNYTDNHHAFLFWPSPRGSPGVCAVRGSHPAAPVSTLIKTKKNSGSSDSTEHYLSLSITIRTVSVPRNDMTMSPCDEFQHTDLANTALHLRVRLPLLLLCLQAVWILVRRSQSVLSTMWNQIKVILEIPWIYIWQKYAKVEIKKYEEWSRSIQCFWQTPWEQRRQSHLQVGCESSHHLRVSGNRETPKPKSQQQLHSCFDAQAQWNHFGFHWADGHCEANSPHLASAKCQRMQNCHQFYEF